MSDSKLDSYASVVRNILRDELGTLIQPMQSEIVIIKKTLDFIKEDFMRLSSNVENYYTQFQQLNLDFVRHSAKEEGVTKSKISTWNRTSIVVKVVGGVLAVLGSLGAAVWATAKLI